MGGGEASPFDDQRSSARDLTRIINESIPICIDRMQNIPQHTICIFKR